MLRGNGPCLFDDQTLTRVLPRWAAGTYKLTRKMAEMGVTFEQPTGSKGLARAGHWVSIDIIAISIKSK